ncbi:hypothetical protein J6590_054468 [Homalodisca vitripennis]|nr:hypothetical protein J6590_054468 [Homalodisca vitripennis]
MNDFFISVICRRLKESYDSEVSDLDSTLKELRARLKDTRAELQKSEDNNAALAAQLSQAQNELLPLRQKIDKLRREHTEAMQQSEAKMALLQRELNETKQSFQEQVNKIHTEKENQLQQVYTRRLKESYDSEVSDLDSTLKELRARLKDTRAELQKSEDNNAALGAQLSQAQNELLPLRQTIDKLRKEHTEAMQQSEAKMALLQRELNETKQSFQEQVNKIHTEKENQLQQVYTRVKEAISKKEDALLVVAKQRDTALEQCSRLEKLLETQRNHSLKL